MHQQAHSSQVQPVQQAHAQHQQNQQSEFEDDDWIRPTLRARFSPGASVDGDTSSMGNKEPWTMSRVSIGAVYSYPTRVRIECHASGDDHPLQHYHASEEVE